MLNRNNENNQQKNNSLPENALPATAALTQEAKEQIQHLRDLGVDDSQMAIVRDVQQGTEEVLINTSGIVSTAHGIGGDPYETIKTLKENGVDLSLDAELAIATGMELLDPQDEISEEEADQFEREMTELSNTMTLGQLKDMLFNTLKTSFPVEYSAMLGGRGHRQYLADQLRRYSLRYGEKILLNDVAIEKKDARAVAVIMNALGMGDPNKETIDRMEKEIASQF